MSGTEHELGLKYDLPREGTLERWAYDYVTSTSLAHKIAPPPTDGLQGDVQRAPLRVEGPGRPSELRVTWDKYKAPKTAHALRDARKRAHLLHTFWHHELQAAELMCWALLAFPDTPAALQRGLVSICQDEIRHMRMYAAHIRSLGFEVGSFAVRDWFWERAPKAESMLQFLALMGLGFEAGNLDHTERYATMFREAGDEKGALIEHVVGEEEIAHVAFAVHWFSELAGTFDFAAWTRALPAPLSPMVMRGKPLARGRRLRAGQDERFLNELEAWTPASRGC